MSDNPILTEIRRVRDEHAQECDFDVHVLFERMRVETEKLRQEGWNIASPVPDPVGPGYTLRDEPPTTEKKL